MKQPAMTLLNAARKCQVSVTKFKVAAAHLKLTPCRRDPRTRRELWAVADIEKIRDYLNRPEILK